MQQRARAIPVPAEGGGDQPPPETAVAVEGRVDRLDFRRVERDPAEQRNRIVRLDEYIERGEGRSLLLGITERLEYVDASKHVKNLKRYRTWGYVMAGNRIAIATDYSADLIEVHPPSRGLGRPGRRHDRAMAAGARRPY